MFRATTPTHIFSLPFETSLLKKILITYKQDDAIILEKTEADCTLDGNDVKIVLTQEETLLFDTENRVFIQLRILTTDGKALASDIESKWAEACLNEEILS